MRVLLGAVVFLILLIPSAFSGVPGTNIIFVFIDDMGYGDLTCYGNHHAKTPEIDRLAKEGIRFTQFYVNAPICSPSRVAVTTGQYPARWKITSYLARREVNAKRGLAQFLDLKAPSLARTLQQAGYVTAHIGKWHMGGQRDVGEAPLIQEYGFDISLTNFEGLGDRVLPLMDNDTGGLKKLGLGVGSEKLGRGKITWEKRYDVTARFVDRALGVIKQAQTEARPFYINLWPDDVHSPHLAPPSLRGDGSRSAHYSGVIKELDRQLGRLFDFVRRDSTLHGNTLIVVASDNGPEHPIGSSGGLRGSKGMIYEGGIRVPFIVWWPGGMPTSAQGTTDTSTVMAGFDLPSSLLSVTGQSFPSGTMQDGEDMSRAFRGQEVQRERPIMWMRPPDWAGRNNDLPDLAIRDGKWKLLVNADGTNPQLYDLSSDTGEDQNLAQQRPKMTVRLSEQVLNWRRALP